jgi:O-antigen ligase
MINGSAIFLSDPRGELNRYVIYMADFLLAYSILAPIILNIVGSYVVLQENFIRTFFVLQVPGIIACMLYLNIYGLESLRRNKAILVIALLFSIIYLVASLRNWESMLARQHIKFFIAYCLFGTIFGLVARFNINRIKHFIRIWIYFSLIFLLFTLIYYVFNDVRYGRYSLPGDNTARTGLVFFFFSLCFLYELAFSNNYIKKIYLIIMFLCCIYLGIVSRSRSAVVIFIFIVSLFALVHYRLSDSTVPKKTIGAAIILFIIFFSVIWFNSDYKKIKRKSLSIIAIPKHAVSYLLHGDTQIYKSVNRLPLWHNAIKKIKHNPIFGNGSGIEYTHELKKKRRSHPHNTMLQVMVETGLVGLSIYLTFLFLVFKKMINQYKTIPDRKGKLFYLFFPLSFLFFFLFSFFHYAIHENYFMWYFAGLIAGFDVEDRDQANTSV